MATPVGKAKRPYVPSPEERALSEARKAKKLAKRSEQAAKDASQAKDRSKISAREWLHLRVDSGERTCTLKIMTWNLLAQCLVRRELFPTSNCLKAKQREYMIYHELTNPNADILCLQEVDRLEKLEPVLETAGYAWHYKCGLGKMHGCLIAYKKNAFRLVRDRLIEYDSQPVRMSDTDTVNCYGRSFTTKNIGSLLALQRIDDVPTGIVVATTHLFWHPKYTYERTRQCGILLREVIKFRDEIFPDKKIPCVITGDFNFQPDDAAYSLLSGDDLLSGQEERILSSMVVHKSVDPGVPATEKSDLEEEEAGDPDRVITNARLATPSDGLLSVAELQNFFGTLPSVVSAYNVGLGCARDMNPLSGLRTFGDRVGIPATRRGRHEPEWTSYTHYWKSVLDYIFVVNPPDTELQVAGLLRPHQTTALEPGLPQQGVCGSDHVSLCAELAWTPTTSSDH